MTAKEDLRRIKAEQIRSKRDGAERARRLSWQFWSAEDRDRTLRFAEELDVQAEELERAFNEEFTAAPEVSQTRKVTQTQVQVQQGPPAEDKGCDKPH